MIEATLIPGDGIGPEVTKAAVDVLAALDVPIQWEVQEAGQAAMDAVGDPLPEVVFASILRTKLCLKGPLMTPIGTGYQSVNVRLRQVFDLYANVRPARTFKGIDTPFKNVDLVIVRENTEGEYSGIEHYLDRDKTIAESISVATQKGCQRIVEHAVAVANRRPRRKLTLAHKANILKLTQGMFLRTGRTHGTLRHQDARTPAVEFDDIIIDNLAMQLVRNPSRFDVIVTTNLFGDILSDLTAGLVGGLGVVGSMNYGDNCAMFEAVHGTAPDIAGKGIANPTAMFMSAVMLLQHIGEAKKAEMLEESVRYVIASGVETTGDIGGKGTTESFTQEIIKLLKLRK